jgi:hypothetical protein
VEVVLTEWEELGEPEAAASGALVQILKGVANLRDKIENQEWLGAKVVLADAKNLLETEEGASFQPGCGDYLKAAEDRLRWAILLKKSASSKDLRGRERQSLIVELSRAESEVAFQLREMPSLKEIHERIKAEIEQMGLFREETPSSGGPVKTLVIVLLMIVLALIAAWLYLRSSGVSAPATAMPLDGQISLQTLYSSIARPQSTS